MLRLAAGLAALALAAGCSTVEPLSDEDPEPRYSPLESWGGTLDEECAPYWQAALEECTPAAPCPQGQVSVCGFQLTMPIGCGGIHDDCGQPGHVAPVVCCSAQVCASCRCEASGEVCGNLLDDDKDGATDEDCPAVLQYRPDLPGMGGSGSPPTPPLKVPQGVKLPQPQVPTGRG